jgi:hypothetical protein
VKLDLQTRRDLRLLAVALTAAIVLALLIWLVLPPAKAGGLREQPSTFFNAPYGTKAAYLVLDKLGYDVQRLRRPIDTDTLARIDALVLLRPAQGVSDYEARVLSRWVAEGHNLLVAPEREVRCCACEEGCCGPGTWFAYARETSPATEDAVPDEEISPATCHPLGEELLVARDSLRFHPEQPLLWPSADLPFEVLWADEQGVLAFETRWGSGRILALADVHALTNRGLDEGGHALWLASLAESLTDGDRTAAFAFDEYHAGFPHEPDMWQAMFQLLWDGRWAWPVTQALIVALLALAAGGVRFGRAEHVPPARRRTQGEFTRAAGQFLRAARAREVAAAAVCSYYRERLCGLLRLSPQAGSVELADALQRRGQAQESEIAEQLTGPARIVNDAALLHLARRLDTVVEALEHGVGKHDRTRPALARRAQ